MSDYFVYLLTCADGTYYCGITTDVERRIEQHNSGKGAKYIIKKRRPAKLAAKKGPFEKGDALREEARIKKLPRKHKLAAFIFSDLWESRDKIGGA